MYVKNLLPLKQVYIKLIYPLNMNLAFAKYWIMKILLLNVTEF